jgi:hypothetical protein
MVDEEELEHPPLSIDRLVVGRVHAHPIVNRSCARRKQLALTLDLNETHAAHGHGLHAGVVTEAGDEDPHLFRDVDEHASLLSLYLGTIDRDVH